MLPVYIELADIFLDDVYATFVLSKITKGTHWRKLAHSNDSQFLHAYFHFVEQAMWASARYAVFLDNSSSKRYKFESFHYALNLPDIRWRKQKKVHTFRVVDSRQHNVMQLVDVILGALASEATASPKVALSEHVKKRIARNTKHGRPKLITYNWIAPKTRRFRPSL